MYVRIGICHLHEDRSSWNDFLSWFPAVHDVGEPCGCRLGAPENVVYINDAIRQILEKDKEAV